MTLSTEDRTEKKETVEIIAHVAKNKDDKKKKPVVENAILHSVRHCKVH